jgi:non-haem dioxygenase in morphine synthesis N-terminal
VLRLARQFFTLPEVAKDEISQLKSPQLRGYSWLGGELTNGTVDWREQIDIGPERAVIADARAYLRMRGPTCGRRRRRRCVPPSSGGVPHCPASGCQPAPAIMSMSNWRCASRSQRSQSIGSARNAKPALAIAESCDGRIDALIPGVAW